MMEEQGVVSPQLRSFSPGIFLLDVSAVPDNTSDSLFAPGVRIHDAQHTRCKTNVNMTFTFDLTRRAFLGLGEFFQPIVKTAFSFPQTHVFVLARAIQKFLTDGLKPVSLILCQKSCDKL
jgi:hypothetical protein